MLVERCNSLISSHEKRTLSADFATSATFGMMKLARFPGQVKYRCVRKTLIQWRGSKCKRCIRLLMWIESAGMSALRLKIAWTRLNQSGQQRILFEQVPAKAQRSRGGRKSVQNI